MEKILPNDIFFAEVERLIAEGSEVRLKVRGTSMRPFLRDGDTVVLVPAAGTDLRPGAVVLFRYRGGHVLHRLAERDGGNLIFRGDSVPAVEEVSADDAVAVVREVVKSGGEVIAYGSRRWGREYAKLLLRRRIRTFLSRVKRRVLHRK